MTSNGVIDDVSVKDPLSATVTGRRSGLCGRRCDDVIGGDRGQGEPQVRGVCDDSDFCIPSRATANRAGPVTWGGGRAVPVKDQQVGDRSIQFGPVGASTAPIGWTWPP